MPGYAFADPPNGALLIFQGESPAAAEAFARQDPYVKNGLITNWKVRPWTVVVGNELRGGPVEILSVGFAEQVGIELIGSHGCG